ncbi:MAG: response regulator [Deltaproteobacteria bacterium]|nr:response regulator [Deltaproteobacteria bacterium]
MRGPPGTRLLVVDDDAVTQAMLADELAAAGHLVDRAGSAEEAIAMLDKQIFDVAFVDMVLPGLSGARLLEILQAKSPRTQAVIITAYPGMEDAIASMQAGAIDYLPKPLTCDVLHDLVRRALERRQREARFTTLEACQEIFAANDPETLPAVIGRAAMRALNADDASLMLADGGHNLRLVWSHSLGGTIHAGAQVALGERVAGKVAVARRPMVVDDSLTEDPRFTGVAPPDRKIRSSIVYPIAVGDRLVGVLNASRLVSVGGFGPTELEEARVLASQAGVALEDARLVRELSARVSELSKAQSCMVQSERLAAIGQLAAGVAHEINNPVAYVMANLDFVLGRLATLKGIAAGAPEATAKDALWGFWQELGGSEGFADMDLALVEARQGTVRIRDIVADMRTLARADNGHEELFDINRAVQSAARLASASIRGVAEVRLDLGEGAMVRGNIGQLSQVFLNLLVNAGQAIPSGCGATARIVVTTRREGVKVIASVADTGVGIPPEVQARIFEPFFTTKSGSRGTGLGLSISRDTVTRHHGAISFWSEVGVGTTFTVALPLADEVPVPARAPASDRLSDGRCRILFVDDEESLRNSYQRYFGGRYDVVTVPDGRRALEVLAERCDFDLVVCDLVMPGMSGMELFRRAREQFPAVGERFVFVTGGVGREEVRKFLDTVRNPTFEKPFRFEQIDELLTKARPAVPV